ncbi:MAG: hypothetical protein H0V31_08070 [Acidobacteria bacterium]|nr:hypothetical protein [Acidobacteriota bacterium]
MKFYSILFIASVAFFFLFPPDAFACACCADAGYYSINVKKPENLELGELKKIQFANANLFINAAGEDSIKGVSSISENYSLNGSLQNNIWKFNFKADKGKTGTLNLIKPVSMVAYLADIHDGKEGGGGGPLLYKEWRFKYKVQSGTGIFQKGIAPAAEYFLVLQGRGNVCTQAEDFTHWRLEITGKKADYAFFGELNAKNMQSN